MIYRCALNGDIFNKAIEHFNINDEDGLDALFHFISVGYDEGIERGIMIGSTAVTLICCVSLIAKRIVTLIKKHDEKNKAKKRSLNKDSFFSRIKQLYL